MSHIESWDDTAVYQLAHDSPELREKLHQGAAEIADIARLGAPVSLTGGSVGSPAGAFKARGFGSDVKEDSQGVPYGMAWEVGNPGNFLGNRARKTRNANQYGHYGYRPATKLFLTEAMHAAEGRSLFG